MDSEQKKDLRQIARLLIALSAIPEEDDEDDVLDLDLTGLSLGQNSMDVSTEEEQSTDDESSVNVSVGDDMDVADDETEDDDNYYDDNSNDEPAPKRRRLFY